VVFYYRNVSWFNNGFCRDRWKGAFTVLILLAAALAGTGCDRGDHPAQVGMAAPDFTVHDQGQTVSLDQYRGKTVVLNFWASWCPPCLEEFPSLMQLQKQVPNVVVLAVSFDTDADAYRQYVADNHLGDMVIALDLSQKSNLAFGTTRPPETYIIDRKGRIRRKFIGAQDWTSPEIENYLRNL
jgi:cytochrome c biogenesis protein CcmG/thiol:disulfide interchange protein DsbE